MRLLAVVFVLFLASVMTGCMSLHKSEVVKAWKSSCIPIKDTKAEACVYETGNRKRGTAFYFHGLADSVKTIEASIYPKDDLIALLTATELSHVAVISYGKDWMLKPYGNGVRSVGEIESVIAGLKLPRPYVGIGISMGGANLLTLCMQRRDLFKVCVATHPMLVREDEYDVGFNFLPGFIVDNHFSLDEWRVSNPFAQLKAVSGLTPTFVTACRKDWFKLYPNTEAWVTEARAKGYVVEWFANDDCEHSRPSFKGVLEFVNQHGGF